MDDDFFYFFCPLLPLDIKKLIYDFVLGQRNFEKMLEEKIIKLEKQLEEKKKNLEELKKKKYQEQLQNFKHHLSFIKINYTFLSLIVNQIRFEESTLFLKDLTSEEKVLLDHLLLFKGIAEIDWNKYSIKED